MGFSPADCKPPGPAGGHAAVRLLWLIFRAPATAVSKEKHVLEKRPMPPHIKPRSKDSILHEADSMRALARRTRRLVSEVTNDSDLESLKRHIKELEDGAARLEKAAIDAKSG